MKSDVEIQIRPEREDDYPQIRELVTEAFALAEHSDGNEQNLIEKIRDTQEYIQELSLVAVSGDTILGHIMFSRISVGQSEAVALAPLAVLHSRQREGIGKLLVTEGHSRARRMGYSCSIVLGDPLYYSRFGYTKASDFGIKAPFDVPDEYYMVCAFDKNHNIPEGYVIYSNAFGL